MKIETQAGTVRISAIPDLRAAEADAFLDQVTAVLPAQARTIEIDLAETAAVDGSGVGALVALYRRAGRRGGVRLRVLNPRPAVRHLLELARVHHLFEISLP